jgi:hypothetical protein
MMLLVFKHLAGDGCRRAGTGPAGIEGQVGDDFRQLFARHAVLQRQLQMKGQFIVPVAGDQRCDRNQAAVAGRQARALPHIAEQHRVGIVGQSGRDIAKSFLRTTGFCHGNSPLNVSPAGPDNPRR